MREQALGYWETLPAEAQHQRLRRIALIEVTFLDLINTIRRCERTW